MQRFLLAIFANCSSVKFEHRRNVLLPVTQASSPLPASLQEIRFIAKVTTFQRARFVRTETETKNWLQIIKYFAFQFEG